MDSREFLQIYIQERIELLLGNKVDTCFVREEVANDVHHASKLFQARNGEIVKCQGKGFLIRELELLGKKYLDYLIHLQYVIKQKTFFYVQEIVELRRLVLQNERVIEDISLVEEGIGQREEKIIVDAEGERLPFIYARLEAVKYAEIWWNSYNPAFQQFEKNNCTNYISQCLYAGNAPMTGYPNRGKGWWYKNHQWSYSWTTPHGLWNYLSKAKTGLRAVKVKSPQELKIGDLIFYDFEGDGRWNHSTIVVAKDNNKMPLVNAQSTNSRYRFWDYRDSYKYTENTKYTFFHIVDDS